VKDTLVIGAVLFAGLAIPIRFFGSPAGMFDQLIRTHPASLVLAPGAAPHGMIWYISTVLLTAIGYGMGPHSVAAAYSAKDAVTLRRNAMLLPLYQLVIPLVFFAGFSALLIVPGLKGTNVDQSFLLVVQRYYSPWVLGLVIAAGSLCALIPATALLLSAGSLIAKNVLSDGFNVARDDRARLFATRTMVVIIAALSLVLWIYKKQTLVELLLLYYNGVTQFMPAFVFGFLWRRTTAWGVAAGIAAGTALVVYLAAKGVNPAGINPGFIALALNVALLVTVSLATQPKQEPAVVAAGSVSQR
jgi:SSS family solute:Na+ symporter